MLKPYEMSRVVVAGQIKVQESVIKELHKLEILHIVEHSKSELADIGDPLESANRLSEIIVKIRALTATLGIKKEEGKIEFKGLSEIDSTTKALSEKVSKLSDELGNTERYFLCLADDRPEFGV